jgi:preprotein translocase subunit SecA
MLKKLVRVLGGDPNKRTLESYAEIVASINELEAKYEALSDEALSAKTNEFRIRLAGGETLEDILPEAFAVVREASKRTIGLRHYDVQLIGGIALHEGIIAEMKTGEGKTLVATLPLYLNALNLNPAWLERARKKWGQDPQNWEFRPLEGIPIGRGTHLVTVNDYLARRDARWKAPIYNLLGLSVGVLQMAARTEHGKKGFLVDLDRASPHEDQHQLQMVPRKQSYNADITYGTNNEFGFDYLRDNMAMSLEDRVQRGHYYAIIDEVDNVLIDEARTPLIISGPSHDDTEWYLHMAQVVRQLGSEDYEINERDRTVTLTEIGETHVEQILEMPLRDPERPEDVTPEQARLLGYLEQALRAEFLYKRNKEYIVQTKKVVIVDDFTGRLMPGRRWSDGLHQAVEAKEGVPVQRENVTYATITIQNYFRMYEKLSGMTGTAVTEAEEFDKIYSLEALAIPTNLEYLADLPDSPLVTLEDRDEYNYKFTYYAQNDDPEKKAIFWKRKDYPDVIYRTEEAKLRALTGEIISYHVAGRPILVGTTSVELSERVSNRLRAEPLRRLLQTLLIRHTWLEVNERFEDGRVIDELQSLNQPLDQLRPSEMRKLIREEGLDISLNPEDSKNLAHIQRILNLTNNDDGRLVAAIQGGISHQVLNARKHTEESQIIAGAGAVGAVTIATNMAGRGVDIKLGGELAEEVLSYVNRILKRAGYQDPYDMSLADRREALLAMDPADYGIYEAEIKHFLGYMKDMELVRASGGLHVIGSERHEARRIDNQLRGRAARQGDPGSSRFYLSLEDELMVRFGGQQMEGMLSRLNVDEALPMEHNLVSRIVEGSQTRVEGANFDVRKHLLEYDDVLNTQRAKIYGQRDLIFTKADLSQDVTEMLQEEVMRRIPEALLDDEGPWKLLAWLSQIQPATPLDGRIYPSYTLKLLLENHIKPETNSIPEARSALLDLAASAIQAEEKHLLYAVNNLLDLSQDRMEDQLSERLETLDTFLEGLELAEEPLSPAQTQEELKSILRLPIKLTSEQLRSLRDDPQEIADELHEVVESAVMVLNITRLLGAVARILQESLDLSVSDLEDRDWDDLADQVLDVIQEIFDKRRARFLDEETGQIVKDLDNRLSRLNLDVLAERDLLSLIVLIPQGRRAAFDKKTHRRVWMRTTRLTYIHLAAQYLEGREPEEVAEDVLEHLEGAQAAIHQVWGQSEVSRLAATRPADLDEDTRAGLTRILGEETFSVIQETPLGELSEDLKESVVDELGRQALTNIYRQLLLRVISELWVEYLTHMEALRVAIGLEAYAQRDPLVQYKNQAFEMFQNLLSDMRGAVVTRMFTFRPRDLSSVQSSVSRPEIQAPPEEAQPAPEKKKTRRGGRRRR